MATAKKRKKKKHRGKRGRGRLIAIILVIAVALILGVVVFFLLRNTPERRYERQLATGDSLYESASYAQAAAAYDAALEIDAKGAAAYRGLVKAYGADANAQGVAEAFEKAKAQLSEAEVASLHTETAAELSAIAERFFAAGEYDRVREIAAGLRAMDEAAAYSLTDRVIEATAPAVGSTVSFGTYLGTSLNWRVLHRDGGQILILCEQLVETKPFTETHIGVAWEYCTLRKWLATEFYTNAFSIQEQNRIAAVMAENPANPTDPHTVTRRPTEEKVFVLSMQEVERYFPSEAERASTGNYWTRTSANRSESGAVIVSAEGAFQTVDARDVAAGVRPCLWLILE
ncbi:MAG: hypothetical protein IK016_03190 [Lachnospiraceae bacterium]|nr:hypothetical protein [Lachnospiraceae bacterium]